MIDWNQVKQLRDEVGTDDFPEVVNLFLEEVEEVIARLRAHPEPTTLAEDLHFLKGSALNLGFQSFSDLCAAGERYAVNGAFQNIDMAVLFRIYEDSKSCFLKDMCQALAA